MNSGKRIPYPDTDVLDGVETPENSIPSRILNIFEKIQSYLQKIFAEKSYDHKAFESKRNKIGTFKEQMSFLRNSKMKHIISSATDTHFDNWLLEDLFNTMTGLSKQEKRLLSHSDDLGNSEIQNLPALKTANKFVDDVNDVLAKTLSQAMETYRSNSFSHEQLQKKLDVLKNLAIKRNNSIKNLHTISNEVKKQYNSWYEDMLKLTRSSEDQPKVLSLQSAGWRPVLTQIYRPEELMSIETPLID